MTLENEIRGGESARLEFKEARPKDSLKFTKTVVAFANGRGGRIIFGVEDGTGRIVGIPREKVFAEMDAITDAIANSCKPSVPISVRAATVGQNVVVVLDVASGDKTPYYIESLGIRKGTFVRVGATSRQAEEYRLKGLILSGENLSFDRQPVSKIKLMPSDVAGVCLLMTEVAKRNCTSDDERKSVKPMTPERMESMELLARSGKHVVPTYGYCFVAGLVAPGILEPRIKCGMFRGTEKGDFIDKRDCSGAIVDQIDQAYQFVVRNIRVGSEIVGTGRRDIYELPLSAIREAICNAVFHRDYLEPSSVYVALYDDRLEILSPGELVRGITLDDAKNGFSKLRNHALGMALEYMKEVEGWGGGVSRYFTACAALGLDKPFVGEEAGFFKVVFYRRKKLASWMRGEPISEPISERLLRAISATPGISKPQLVDKVGKSRATVTRALSGLCREGSIEYRGSKKTGGYFPV